MRVIRLTNAARAAGLMFAGAGILAMPGGGYLQPARAESQSWAVTMQGMQAAQAAPAPQHQAVPASLPSKDAAVPVPASPQTPGPAAAAKPAAPAIKKANARELFGAAKEPANLAARSIGFYAKGCLAGGKPLPVNGPAWQVMRLSRNRNWGHPSLIRYIERFAQDAKEHLFRVPRILRFQEPRITARTQVLPHPI